MPSKKLLRSLLPAPLAAAFLSTFLSMATTAQAALGPVAADVLVVIDESGSMSGEQRWVADVVPSLEQNLVSYGVGSEGQSNLYGLIGFGDSRVVPRSLLLGGKLLGSPAEFVQASSGLRVNGGTEDGWRGIEFALDTYPRRSGAVVNIILATDEDRDNTNSAITFNTVLAKLQANNALLNAVVNATLRCGNNTPALGMDSTGVGYVADGSGGFTTCSGARAISGSGTTVANYVNLAVQSGGAVWDLNFLRSGGHYARSFTNALLSIKVDEILDQRPVSDLVAVVQAVPNPAAVGQQVTLDGAKSFHLLEDRTIVSWEWDLNNDGVYDATGPLVTTTFPAIGQYPVTLRVTDDSATPLVDIATLTVNVATGALKPTAVAGGPYLFCPQDTHWWLDGSRSVNPDDGLSAAGGVPDRITEYAWDLNNDLNFSDSTGATINAAAQLQALGVGDHVVRLRVTDNNAAAFPGPGQTNLSDISITQVSVRDASDLLCNCLPDLAARPKNTKVQLTWTDTGAYQYAVYRSLQNGGPYQQIAVTDSRYSTFLDLGLQLDTPYHYVVSALGRNGAEICRSRQISATPTARRLDPANRAPAISSTPVTAATEGTPYRYDVNATDPDARDTVTYSLSVAPVGMTIDAVSGLISWTPVNAQVGQHAVTVQASDIQGAFTNQSFVITVANSNQQPAIVSQPVTTATENVAYRYLVQAVDPDLGDQLAFALASAPAGMTINSQSGEISWTPTAAQVGDQAVEVQVADAAGAIALQNFVVVVAGQNFPPSITSTPVVAASAGQEYRYDVEAADPNAGDMLTFALGAFPDGMLIDTATGLIVWTPTPAQVGAHAITVVVSDNRNASSVQSFQIDVAEQNLAPVFTAGNLPQATEDVGYVANIVATDPNAGDQIAYSLVAGPAGLVIDAASGQINWLPRDNQAGSNTILVRATDNAGLFSEASFLIQVLPVNDAPLITSSPLASAQSQSAYSYQVAVEDPDAGDTLAFALTQAPAGMTISSNGLIEWLPPANAAASYAVQVTVTDAIGASDSQSFNISLLNREPAITSLPAAGVPERQLYSYPVQAQDADGDTLSFALQNAPASMFINAASGLLQWQTQAGDEGSYAVVVTVADGRGGFATQNVLVTIHPPANTAPVISSTPVLAATEGAAYAYQVLAQDGEADPLSYTLTSAPQGMVMSAGGLISWTPDATQVGDHAVAVQVSDGRAQASQNFTLVVNAKPNTAPQISSVPMMAVQANTAYQYQVVATDVDNEALTFSLPTAPAGMSISNGGLVNWTADDTQLGGHAVVVRVTDARGAFVQQSFTLAVQAVVNHPPVISSAPVTVAMVGQSYSYAVAANDPENAPLTYSLAQAPTGMSVTMFGDITWTPLAAQVGSHAVVVQVTDGTTPVTQNFNVVVSEPADLNVSIQLSDDVVAPGEAVTIQVVAADAINPVYALTVNGSALTVDGNGVAQFSSNTSGIYQLVAQVQSGDGSSGTGQTVLRVSVAGDTVAPVANIIAPADGTAVYDATAITGTVTDANLYRYRLLVAEAGSSDFAEFAVGTAPVTNGNLASFDPSLLKNGLYTVLLIAEDINGLQSQDNATVRVEGALKPGVVKLSFVDMTVPVAGIPITIERTYDSRVKTQRDLGVGWDLSIRQGEYKNNREPGKGWGVANSGGFFRIPCYTSVEQAYHTTDIRLSENESYQFRPRINLSGYGSVISGGCLGQAEFVQVSGPSGAQLQPIGNNNVFYMNGTDVFTYDLGDPEFGEPWVPNAVRLTTPDGRVFDLDLETGITRLQNANGNQLFISSSGVVNSTGQGVVFTRDGNGRIASIRDPLGNLVRYAYDANDNLVGFTNQMNEETTYQYHDSPFLNHLKSITLPNGSVISSFDYDEDGRLSRSCDQSGCATAEYDLAGRTQTNIDATGRAITYVYDAKGNVISQRDALGNIQSFSYDANGNLLEHTDAEGNVTRQTWDANNRLQSVTEPHAAGENPADFTTRYTYDAKGNLLTATSPSGAQQVNSYDTRGNLLSMANESGYVLSSYAYDSNGRQTREASPFGSLDLGYGSNGALNSITDEQGVATVLGFDAAGKITSFTHNGVSAAIGYDPMGRETSIGYSDGLSFNYGYDFGDSWTSLEGSTIPRMERSFTAKGAPNDVVQADGSAVSWEYDAAGRVVAEINALGGRSTYQYDAAGRLVAETDPAGATTRYELDGNGRVLAIVNPLGGRSEFSYHPDGRQRSRTDATGRTWSYEFSPTSATALDPLGRSVTTETTAHGLVSRVVNADGTSRSWTYLAPSESLDGAEMPTRFTDEAGRVRNFTYDAQGRLSGASDFAGQFATYVNDTSGLRQITDAEGEQIAFAYDGFGDVLSVAFGDGTGKTLSYDANRNLASVTLASGANKTLLYDVLGQLVTDNRSTGESFGFTWDANGNLDSASDSLGSTDYQYDVDGNLIELNSSVGGAVEYGYDDVGRVVSQTVRSGSQARTITYGYDAAGRISRVTDPNAGDTIFVYDAAGRLQSRSMPNGVSTAYEYDARDQLLAVTHRNGANAIISSTRYTRNTGGEPSRITWHDGSYVDLEYDSAIRVTHERFFDNTGVLARHIQYDYDLVGNRTSRIVDGAAVDYSYGPGHRLLSATGAGVAQNYAYNSDGRVSNIARDDLNANLTYNFEGQLRSVATGGSTLSYVYDASGRRIQASDGSTTLRYLRAASVQGAYENPQAVLDGSANLAQAYVYAGDQPLQRISNTGTRYYLTDGMGSVIAITDEAGNVVGSVKYDAFGREFDQQGDMTVPASAGGDFRFQGQWKEAATGLYYMRARDYDPESGRFLSADPAEPDFREPESLNRYLFANSNPYLFADPSGRFTLVSVNISINIQATLQTIAIQIAKDYLIDKARSVIGSMILSALKNFTALNSFSPWGFIGVTNPADAGRIWEQKVQNFICSNVPDSMREIVWFEPSIGSSGFASSDGYGCPGGGSGGFSPAGSSKPDFMLTKTRPSELGKNDKKAIKAYLIGESKLSLKSYYDAYVRNGNATQFRNIITFAEKRVYTRTAVFLALYNGGRNSAQYQAALQSLLNRTALRKGVAAIMVSAI
ncbi:MAG: PKD domain-containing protein [Gammaproteobacteria bacterium]|nr:PKD domain-containing protein [Gammaproteobacteria bacterium]